MILGMLLLGLGLALVAAEVLVPSMGVLSVLAATSIAAAIVVAFRDSSETGVQFLVATALLVPAVVLVGFKLFPRSPVGRRMVSSGLSFESARATDERDLALDGVEGVVEATCRPAGIARLAGRRVDVVTRGEILEEGTPVRVVEVSGNRVVVVRTAPAAGARPAAPPAGTPSAGSPSTGAPSTGTPSTGATPPDGPVA